MLYEATVCLKRSEVSSWSGPGTIQVVLFEVIQEDKNE